MQEQLARDRASEHVASRPPTRGGGSAAAGSGAAAVRRSVAGSASKPPPPPSGPRPVTKNVAEMQGSGSPEPQGVAVGEGLGGLAGEESVEMLAVQTMGGRKSHIQVRAGGQGCQLCGVWMQLTVRVCLGAANWGCVVLSRRVKC